MNITFNSILPDFDGNDYRLVNVKGVVTVKLTSTEASKFIEDEGFIDTITAFASAGVDDARFTVTSWTWSKYFMFDSWEVMLEPEMWEAAECGECGRELPCRVHE